MGENHKRRLYFCKSCMQKFQDQEIARKHQQSCESYGIQTIRFPKKPKLVHNKVRYSMLYPIFIAADFETCAISNSDMVKNNLTSYDIKKELKACSYSFVAVGLKGVLMSEYYCGNDIHIYSFDK